MTNTWQLDAGSGRFLRLVQVREPDGTVRPRLLPDEHPALSRFLDRAAAAAVAS